MEWLHELCRLLQESPLALAFRESSYMYPIVEGSHVLSLALSVGMIMWFDLRLLGVTMRKDSVSNVFEQVRPWMILGFTLMFITGAMLFSAHAVDAYESTYFRVKVGLLVLGALNVLLFHSTIDRARSHWDTSEIPPLRARVAGGLSLVLWFGIIAAGRIMAFNL